jgi:GTP cyclohydrolase I/GTP cyclohydrolase-4
MLRMAIDEFGPLGDDIFVSAHQRNLETIHQHDVVAEREGLLGELSRELDGADVSPTQTTMRDWLHAV